MHAQKECHTFRKFAVLAFCYMQKLIAIPLVIVLGLWIGDFFKKTSGDTRDKDQIVRAKAIEERQVVAETPAKLPEPAMRTLKPAEVELVDSERIRRFFNSGKVPTSIADLKRRSTPMRLPTLSEDPQELDNGIAGVYKGYVFESSNEVRKVRISMSNLDSTSYSGSIEIETLGKMNNFEFGTANQRNYAGDTYSFIHHFPDGKITYLKLFSGVTFSTYSMKLRVLIGWISDPSTNRTLKIALMDDMSIVDQKDWPDRELIEPLLPQKALRP